jgi:rhodanese-related sulfurtransferase
MGVRTISVDVLAGWLQSAEPPRLIDVLSQAHFERAHVPGAENIPRVELPGRAPREIALDEAVVVYCAHRLCRESCYAAVILAELGYWQVYGLEGGLAEWRRLGLPLAPRSRAARAGLRRRSPHGSAQALRGPRRPDAYRGPLVCERV